MLNTQQLTLLMNDYFSVTAVFTEEFVTEVGLFADVRVIKKGTRSLHQMHTNPAPVVFGARLLEVFCAR